jgi:CRP-like cAMP-binding protein
MEKSHYDFAIDLKKIGLIGSLHPDGLEALQAYNEHGMSSEERLYHQLIKDLALDTAAYKPETVLFEIGQAVTQGYIIRQGDIELRTDGLIYRVGPGAVLGLASGLANLPHKMSAKALTVVTASIIPHKVFNTINSCHIVLRGINRSTIMRTLNLSSVPEKLK